MSDRAGFYGLMDKTITRWSFDMPEHVSNLRIDIARDNSFSFTGSIIPPDHAAIQAEAPAELEKRLRDALCCDGELAQQYHAGRKRIQDAEKAIRALERGAAKAKLELEDLTDRQAPDTTTLKALPAARTKLANLEAELATARAGRDLLVEGSADIRRGLEGELGNTGLTVRDAFALDCAQHAQAEIDEARQAFITHVAPRLFAWSRWRLFPGAAARSIDLEKRCGELLDELLSTATALEPAGMT